NPATVPMNFGKSPPTRRPTRRRVGHSASRRHGGEPGTGGRVRYLGRYAGAWAPAGISELQMAYKVYVDGQEGTTGLQINEYLSRRADIELLRIDPALRKDAGER